MVISKPSSAVAGDVLIAGIAWFGNHSSFSPTPPAGWTLIRSDTDTPFGQFTYYKVVGASEPSSYTWTGLEEYSAGGITAYSGVDTANPINGASGSVEVNSGTVVAPSITTTRGNVMLIGVFGLADETPHTPPGSMTTLWSGKSAGTGGANVTSVGAQQSWATAGPTGTRTATAPSGSKGAGTLIALQPPIYPHATTTWTPSTSSYEDGQVFTRTSGATVQRTASLPATTTSQTDGPLTTGVTYTTGINATFYNWVSPTSTTTFTGRSCP
jgi:hypothetical protein